MHNDPIVHTCRQCKIPWHFLDISLTFHGTPTHVTLTHHNPNHVFTFFTCHTHIIVSVHCTNTLLAKLPWLPVNVLALIMSQCQLPIPCIQGNSFPWQDFVVDMPLTIPDKRPIHWHFPGNCNIPWHFQVYRFSRKVATLAEKQDCPMHLLFTVMPPSILQISGTNCKNNNRIWKSKTRMININDKPYGHDASRRRSGKNSRCYN